MQLLLVVVETTTNIALLNSIKLLKTAQVSQLLLRLESIVARGWDPCTTAAREVALTHNYQVNVLISWYKSVNFEAESTVAEREVG